MQFGQVLTFDKKFQHKKELILSMIEGMSRLTLTQVILDRREETVVQVVVRRWIRSG